jgi:crossover junction endodeoxyribonuclease RuvC
MSGVGIMGIDPGLGGGIAVLSDNGVLLEPMPRIKNELDLNELARIISDHASDIRCAFLEQVSAMPKQGVSSMFKFGRVYGVVEGMLAANKVPVVYVRPQVWMKVIHQGAPAKFDAKDRSKLVFARLFPKIDAKRTPLCRGPDSGLVDAALIAEYGRRSYVH